MCYLLVHLVYAGLPTPVYGAPTTYCWCTLSTQVYRPQSMAHQHPIVGVPCLRRFTDPSLWRTNNLLLAHLVYAGLQTQVYGAPTTNCWRTLSTQVYIPQSMAHQQPIVGAPCLRRFTDPSLWRTLSTQVYRPQFMAHQQPIVGAPCLRRFTDPSPI